MKRIMVLVVAAMLLLALAAPAFAARTGEHGPDPPRQHQQWVHLALRV